MKKVFIFAFLIIAPYTTSLSQNLVDPVNPGYDILVLPTAYTYDDCGNRISRSLVAPVIQDSLPGVIVWNVGELGGKTVQLTPRPSQGELTIDIIGYEQTDNCAIGIYDANGHTLTTQSINATSTDIQYNRVQNQTDIIQLKLNGETAAWMITDTNN